MNCVVYMYMYIHCTRVHLINCFSPSFPPSLPLSLSLLQSQVDPVTATPSQSVYASVCTALEILTFLFLVLVRVLLWWVWSGIDCSFLKN